MLPLSVQDGSTFRDLCTPGDKEEVGGARKEDDLDQGAVEAVQLPQREADDIFLLCCNSAQDDGTQGTRISSQNSVQSVVKWCETQISNEQSWHTDSC